jgi:hypothetical protein
MRGEAEERGMHLILEFIGSGEGRNIEPCRTILIITTLKERMTEHLLCNSIVEFLNYHGCKVWRQNAGMARMTDKYGKDRMIKIGHPGISDIIGVSKTGKFIAIEVKLPERRRTVTTYQQMFLAEIHNHGGIAGVACSEEEALKIIEKNS